MDWSLNLNSESHDVSDAAWVMLFVDGQMSFYAEPDDDGNPQMLPAKDDNTRGYIEVPFYEVSAEKEKQYEIIKQTENLTYWRLIPNNFCSS